MVTGAMTAIQTTMSTIWNAISGVVTTVWETIKSVVQVAILFIKEDPVALYLGELRRCDYCRVGENQGSRIHGD